MKQKKITQTMRMEQEIKEEIKSMFSVQKLGDEENGNKRSLNNKVKQDGQMPAHNG